MKLHRCIPAFIMVMGNHWTAAQSLPLVPLVDSGVVQQVQQRGMARIIVGIRPSQVSTAVSASAYVAQGMSAELALKANITAINDTTVVAHADPQMLERLSKDPRVSFIVQDVAWPPTLNDAPGLIGSPQVWAGGHSGQATAIAILDTGVEASHPMLAGKVKDEACFSVTDPTAGAVSLCPHGIDTGNGNWADTAPGSATNCPMTVAGCEHGTHVAGIAVGHEAQDGIYLVNGVARDADVVAVQVYSRFDRKEDCGLLGAPCALSFISSQLRALQYVHSRVLDHVATGRGPRIVAVNMSLGGGHHPAVCDGDTPSYTQQVQQLRQEGVVTFVAAGNDSYIDAVGFPACISPAVAVGALDDKPSPPSTWALAGFSDRAGDSLVSLLAFGVNIRSAVPGGGFKVLSGTSMAAPMAAGAYAVLAGAFPSMPADQILKALHDTGQAVKEPVSGKMLPAIQLASAYGLLAQQTGAPGLPPLTVETTAAPGGGGQSTSSASRFIVEIPGGVAANASVLQSLQAIGATPETGQVGVSQITPNTLSITTERPVAADKLRQSLQDHSGGVGNVKPDVASPPSQ